jgi:3-oxoacyl-[acyl-carrier protein] reductase
MRAPEDLSGRVAVVTGAGRNIGQAIALKLARRGAHIVVVDMDRQRADTVAAEVEMARPDTAALAFVGDVSNSADVSNLVSAAIARFGRIDTLVNNVATTDRGATILDLPEEEWRRVLDVTLSSVFLCSQQIARQMVAQGQGGSIVNIGSTSAYGGRGNAVAYPTAKSALFGLTKSMAIQLGPARIRVNLVAPNKAGSPVGKDTVSTDRAIRNLVGRPAAPEDIANAVAFLVSDDASFITGVDLLVDGGALLVTTVD